MYHGKDIAKYLLWVMLEQEILRVKVI